MIAQVLDLILNLDVYLQLVITAFPTLTYLLLFLILFLETGIVITPFLPGDSLLFAAGALAAIGAFNITLLFLIVFIAAVLGDTVNYYLGEFFGPKVFKKESSFFFNKNYLIHAQKYYEKHGKKTIILARFIPVIRTFAPFVAGIGKMPYKTFISYNIIGGFLWCALFVFSGFLFGNIPFVKENFGIFVVAIILTSFIPLIDALIKHARAKKKN